MNNDAGGMVFENIDDILTDRIIEHTKKNTESKGSAARQKKSKKKKYAGYLILGILAITGVLLLIFLRPPKK